MPLVKQVLKEGIKQLGESVSKIEDKEIAAEAYADGLATLIDAYIKSATVIVEVMPSTSPSGPGTAGPGTGTLQ